MLINKLVASCFGDAVLSHCSWKEPTPQGYSKQLTSNWVKLRGKVLLTG